MTESLVPRQTIVTERAPRIKHINKKAMKQLAKKAQVTSPIARRRKRSARKDDSAPLNDQANTIFYNTYSMTNLKIATPNRNTTITVNSNPSLDLSNNGQNPVKSPVAEDSCSTLNDEKDQATHNTAALTP
mmetsp:Transcript_18993/g.25706  ORF Transcript_18993/g.25706 Transcript_18993/m.25706 type:complete len:131 (-) Transcript_18993:471-863(-)